MRKILIVICSMFFSCSMWAWNNVGHQLIAQIAYDQMTEEAKHTFNRYNHALDKVYKPISFIAAAVWLDTIRYQDVPWFNTVHYVDIPFSQDTKRTLPSPQNINAIWAIEKSNLLLGNKYATEFDKGVAFRVVLHVVGDIHQPLHAITRVSNIYPQGDRGGGLVLLKGNPVAKNLHAYWDRGAGKLKYKRRLSPSQIKQLAMNIEQKWPCREIDTTIDPTKWAQESYQIAIKQAYRLPITASYQANAQYITEKRLAEAGCRLAFMLNALAAK